MTDDLKRLWAPWRMEYIRSTESISDANCIFCEKSESGNDMDNLIVYRGKSAFVLLNLYPYNNGHLMVAPLSHLAKFGQLDSDTKVELMELCSDFQHLLESELNADGINMGANFGEAAGAGIKDHLHFHIVPRWSGDTNFMAVTAHTKVMVDGLKETCRQLQESYKKMKN